MCANLSICIVQICLADQEAYAYVSNTLGYDEIGLIVVADSGAVPDRKPTYEQLTELVCLNEIGVIACYDRERMSFCRFELSLCEAIQKKQYFFSPEGVQT